MIPASQVVPEPGPHGRIFDTLRAVVDSYVSYFESKDVALPVDDDDHVIAFISDGSVAYDQPLFAAEFIRYREGAPGTPQSSQIFGNTEYAIEMTLHLLRYVPVVDPSGVPAPEVREEASKQLLLDADMLARGAVDLTATAMAGGPDYMVAPYRRLQIAEIVPYGPHGGIGGNTATIAVDAR